MSSCRERRRRAAGPTGSRQKRSPARSAPRWRRTTRAATSSTWPKKSAAAAFSSTICATTGCRRRWRRCRRAAGQGRRSRCRSTGRRSAPGSIRNASPCAPRPSSTPRANRGGATTRRHARWLRRSSGSARRGGRSGFSGLTRRQDDRSLAWQTPCAVGEWLGNAAAAIIRVLARPYETPHPAGDGSDQRLRDAGDNLVPAEVDDQQNVVPVLGEVAQQEGMLPKRRAVHRQGAFGEYGAAQRQEVAMQRQRSMVAVALAGIENAAPEGLRVGRVGDPPLHFGTGEAGKLNEEFAAAFPDQPAEPVLMVGEKQKWRRSAEFLALEEHRDGGRQQQIGGYRPPVSRTCRLEAAQPGAGIGDLVVILQIGHEIGWREVEGRRAARLLLPSVPLALVEEAVLGGGDELARAAVIVAVIGFAAPGDGNHRGVVEIVVPQRVEAIPAGLGRAHHSGVLRLVFGGDEGFAAACGSPHLPLDRRQDVIARRIENLLGRVEPQPAQMIFVDPIAGIGDEELAHREPIRSFEIERLAPLVGVAIGEIGGRKRG